MGPTQYLTLTLALDTTTATTKIILVVSYSNLRQGAWLIYRARWEQAMLGTSRTIVIILGKIGLKNISTYKAVFLKLLSAA